MTDVLAILRQRRARRIAARRAANQRLRRTSLGLGFIVSVIAAFALLAGAFAYADLTRDLPSLDQIPILLNPDNGQLLHPTRLLDRTGQHTLTTLTPPNQTPRYLPLDPSAESHIPSDLVNVTIFTLDPNFWVHPGYVLDGIDNPNLHPTLAQRLAVDLLLWNEPPSLRRAIRERLLAAQMTARFGREQILAWYLNSADYGRYAYGIESAAQLYFGKPAPELNLAESILLAGVSASPALNPIDARQAAIERQISLLQAMNESGAITAEQAAQARATAIYFKSPQSADELTHALTGLVLDQLGSQLAVERITRGGLDIITSIDYDLQLQAGCALKNQLARLRGDNTEIPAAGGVPCDAARYLSSLPVGASESEASASLVMIDPQTGRVLALVGDVQAHPAGSLVTPFIYLTGFTRGLSPASVVWDVPGGLSDDVTNPDGRYHGPVRLRVAMANDYLVPAGQVLTQMGADNVARTAASFGLDFPAGADDSLLAGDVSLSPLVLAKAYGVFAAQGWLNGQETGGGSLAPAAVLRVETVDHAVWLDWSAPQSRQLVSPQLSYLINHSLNDDSARWASLGRPSILDIGRPAGAKIGQTLDQRNTWTAGYTPARAAVVWMGGENLLDPQVAAGLWAAVMQYATRSLPEDGWVLPPGVTMMDVCDPSGLLPTANCPGVVSEVFLNGNEPTQYDDLYQAFEINRETGFLATVFTPAQLIERRVYLVVPPAARAWADAAGLPTPPDTYDTIQSPRPTPDAHITSPGMFSDIYGVVPVMGSASGDGFLYYRLQYGQGLNPQQWLQIGDKSATALREGRLIEWDTTKLNGLYALQLQVVRLDGTLETATIQVNIDNTTPEVDIFFPQDGGAYTISEYPRLTFQIQAGDNLFLTRVEIYLDGKLLDSRIAPPFALTWPAKMGQHTLRVIAVDRAGNQAEKSIRFMLTK